MRPAYPPEISRTRRVSSAARGYGATGELASADTVRLAATSDVPGDEVRLSENADAAAKRVYLVDITPPRRLRRRRTPCVRARV